MSMPIDFSKYTRNSIRAGKDYGCATTAPASQTRRRDYGSLRSRPRLRDLKE